MQNIKSASTGQCNNQQATENVANRASESKASRNGPLSRKLSSGNSYERSSSFGNEETERIRRHSRESGSGEFY
jgi:hypothetical protein